MKPESLGVFSSHRLTMYSGDCLGDFSSFSFYSWLIRIYYGPPASARPHLSLRKGALEQAVSSLPSEVQSRLFIHALDVTHPTQTQEVVAISTKNLHLIPF